MYIYLMLHYWYCCVYFIRETGTNQEKKNLLAPITDDSDAMDVS